jgi:NAD-dependent SIR2 family protein deacetylase
MKNYRIEQSELLRIFAVQTSPNLMFFLGAGASVRGGVPTASEMIWIFKREIYCSERGASQEAFRDLTVASNQRCIQEYFESKSGFPSLGAENEYSFYFERCYPDPQERRAFIRQKLQNIKPTIGHECLAALFEQGCCDWIWTTNFDDLIERAQRPDSSRRLSDVSPESHKRIETIISENIRPVLVKLHGDYRYDNLQNTDKEIRSLDEILRKNLTEMCKDNGVVFIGYSGRDESIMSTLEAALAKDGFRNGIYWCFREGDKPLGRVESLICDVVKVRERGGFVEIDSFDDVLYRLYKQCNLKDVSIDTKAKTFFEQRKPFIFTTVKKSQNPLKLNAIKVVEYPSSPFKFKTAIKTWQELREIVDKQPIAAGLLAGNVVSFGNKELIKSVFNDKIIGPIEVSDVTPADLARSDGAILGLYYDMIGRSLTETYCLNRKDRHTFFLSASAIQGNGGIFKYKHLGKQYSMSVVQNESDAFVNEAFSFQLEYHEENCWFILVPQVVITSDGLNLDQLVRRKIISNKVLSKRYNIKVHEMLLFWYYYLLSFSNPISFVFPPRDETGVKIVLDGNFAFSSLVTL